MIKTKIASWYLCRLMCNCKLDNNFISWRTCQKQTFRVSFIGRRLLCQQFVGALLQLRICIALTRQCESDNSRMNTHGQHTTALRPTLHRLFAITTNGMTGTSQGHTCFFVSLQLSVTEHTFNIITVNAPVWLMQPLVSFEAVPVCPNRSRKSANSAKQRQLKDIRAVVSATRGGFQLLCFLYIT